MFNLELNENNGVENCCYKYSLKRRKISNKETRFNKPESVAEHLRQVERIHEIDYEILVALMLDTKNGLLGSYMISQGLVDRSIIHAREVFRIAIVMAATKLILSPTVFVFS